MHVLKSQIYLVRQSLYAWCCSCLASFYAHIPYGINCFSRSLKTKFFSVLRIRDVYPGSQVRLFSMPDPTCLHPGSRILIKEFQYFNPKKMVSKLLKIWSGLFIPDLDADFLLIPDPRSRGQKGTQSRILDPGSGSAVQVFLSSKDETFVLCVCINNKLFPNNLVIPCIFFNNLQYQTNYRRYDSICFNYKLGQNQLGLGVMTLIF
jgi:hypothetical protein